MVSYSNIINLDKTAATVLPVWYSRNCIDTPKQQILRHPNKQKSVYKNYCLISVLFSFVIGLSCGIILPLLYSSTKSPLKFISSYANQSSEIRNIFYNNSYSKMNNSDDYNIVSFVESSTKLLTSDQIVVKDIYWSSSIEKRMPKGYDYTRHQTWTKDVIKGIAVKLESGCGRMQNRLVTFQDGSQGCARYRQNTDQIQGELFSFYLGRILNLSNLAPSTVNIVNLELPLWQNIASEIAGAQWNINRPIVLTKFIPNLDTSNIPKIFRPLNRHLNKHDVEDLPLNNRKVLDELVELAQWSDLIVFDYLTANLDRIVNNLYNYQWNTNIMDAPAHNLARSLDNNLLIFLDNESGLLHGYRLLEKYEIYHSLLLENLCLFRRSTADIVRKLKRDGNVGTLLKDMFQKLNNRKIRDVLPTLPDKSIKILNERIDKVYGQIVKCEAMFNKDVKEET